jgi:hypothetical protein
MTKSRGIRPPRRPWTDAESCVLRERYPREKTEVVAKALGHSVRACYNKAKALGLRKTSEFLASPDASRLRRGDNIGAEYRFKSGLVPWNKGMKGLQYEASKATQFKPGTMPHNTQPIGSHKYDKDGTLLRKISDAKGNNSTRWRSVHELVWVEVNGPLPPKHIVIFKPGMRTNVLEEITVDRVECISLAENMRRNTRHNLPKEINEVIQLRAVLTRHINKRSKHEQREEND